MASFRELVRFGFSNTMLYNKAFDDPAELYASYKASTAFPEYEALESFLPEDNELRKSCLSLLRKSGMVLNYNSPGYFQLDGPNNICSDDPETRKGALAHMLQHVDFAGEAESPLFVLTGCTDQGDEKRPELIRRYSEAFLVICERAAKYDMRVLIEPIERHRFKRLLWGPTAETTDFVRKMREQGASNGGLMLDIAHLPLMEETLDEAIAAYGEIGFEHLHMGEAVLDPDNIFYGHTHPPIGVHGGLFRQQDLVDQFVKFIEIGYIPKKSGGKRASISLEVNPYPGASEATSIRLMYERCYSAFMEAAGRCGI